MGIRMFIDDERDPVGTDWIICRSYDEVATYIQATEQCPSFISFDHDLGEDLSGYDIANLIIRLDVEWKGQFIPEDFSFYCHTQNPVGKRNIEQLLNRYLEIRKDFN